MITSIEGALAGSGVDWVDVAVGGVTLRISVPGSAIDALGAPGERVRVFTSLVVREDSLTLFGFPTVEGRSAFEALVRVNGVGPRVALSVLSTLTPDAIALAIAAGDPDAFKRVSGVGTKTANRIVLELKGKLDWEPLAGPASDDAGDLVSALTALGYTTSEVMAAVSTLPRDGSMSLEERVRLCIERMGSR